MADNNDIPDQLPEAFGEDPSGAAEQEADANAAAQALQETIVSQLDAPMGTLRTSEGAMATVTGRDRIGKSFRELTRRLVQVLLPLRYDVYRTQKYEKGKNPTLPARRAAYVTLAEQAALVFAPGAHRDSCVIDIVVREHDPEVYATLRAALDKAEAENDLTAAQEAMSALFVRFLRVAYTVPGH